LNGSEGGAGITINTAGMGQAPFWVAFIGGLTVLKMIRHVHVDSGDRDNGKSEVDNDDGVSEVEAT
jgi:hypothetical protein